jgi:NitT/TauT family transport system permease protein
VSAAPPAGVPRGRSRLPVVPPVITRALLFAALLGMWELLPRVGAVRPIFLPPLSDAVTALWDGRSGFAGALGATLGEVAIALLIVWLPGAVIGLVIGGTPALRSLSRLASSLYAIPLVVVYPLLVAWMGFDTRAKVIFGALYGLIPMITTTAAGVASLDRHPAVVARSFGASRAQVLRHVVVPHALPSLFAALRIAGGLAFIGVVVAEMLSSTEGIGYVITANRSSFNSELVYAAVLLVLILAYLLDSVLALIERAVSPWPSDLPR